MLNLKRDVVFLVKVTLIYNELNQKVENVMNFLYNIENNFS